MNRNLVRRALQQAAGNLRHDDSGGDAVDPERDALRTLVIVLRQEFGDELFAEEKAGAAHNVLYSLNPETSPWAAIGVHGEAEQAIWDLYGFGPQEAKVWLDAGYGAETAHEWRHHDTSYAFDCLRRGWTQKEGREWKGWDGDEAQRWIDVGADRDLATSWKSHGPEDAAYVRQLREWGTNFWRIPDEKKYAEQWGDTPLADAVRLIPKGYTLRSARSALKKGFTPATAPPVRGDALVAGKTFPKLISAAAEAGGWTVPKSVSDIDGIDQDPTVEATFFNADVRRRLVVIFTASGRFLACDDNWERTALRSVKDVETIIAYPQRRIPRRR